MNIGPGDRGPDRIRSKRGEGSRRQKGQAFQLQVPEDHGRLGIQVEGDG